MENTNTKIRSLEETKEAARIAIRNSYIKGYSGDDQLFYMFVAGMRFQLTGEKPEDELNKIG